MTEHEIRAVTRLQGYGLDYRQIGDVTGIDKETLRTFIRRHPVADVTPVETDGFCRSCGRPVSFTAGYRAKLFCGTDCRVRFWNAHRDRVHHRTWRTFTCKNCGKAFEADRRREHKYCSRACYYEALRSGRHD